ncbi:MAG: DUF3054 domain-containing protein [Gordonia sp. (in: high G+C Gram-positive bacteria)]|uniref:DUF3054 domain-containing protein n=1 Tax=Gordonia sp. (in: high G+C Gram-positive bacteria) TaxID=84139 RepID=UPI0039E232C2
MTTPAPRPAPAPPASATVVLGAMALDLTAVAVFVAVGRASHDEGASIWGYLNALWPFLTGWVIGWSSCLLIDALLRMRAVSGGRPPGTGWQPQRLFPAGVTVWIGTVAIGMLLRWVSGQGTAAAFIVVASIATAILLLGWRLVALLLGRRTARRG